MPDPLHDTLAAVRKALALDAPWPEDRLTALHAHLHDCTVSGWADREPDPYAAHEILIECWALYRELSQVFADELAAREAEARQLAEAGRRASNDLGQEVPF